MTAAESLRRLALELDDHFWVEATVTEHEDGRVTMVVRSAKLEEVEASVKAAFTRDGVACSWLASQPYEGQPGARNVTVSVKTVATPTPKAP